MITYKNKKIKTEWESHYKEIREREGCDTRGTGTYQEISYEIFRVGLKKFESLKDAKRYIDSLYNAKEIKSCIKKYKNSIKDRNTLDENLDKLYKQIIDLGYDSYKLKWHREG